MNNEMAKITMNQLTASNNGIGRLSMMIGAKNFVRDENKNNVMFSFAAKAKNKANKCRITLNSMDLYDVEFFNIRGANFKTISSFKNIYNDQLKELFESETGLYLSF